MKEPKNSTKPSIYETIGTSLDLDECLKSLLDKTVELLSVEIASIMWLDKDGRHLFIKYAKGLDSSIIGRARIPLDEENTDAIAPWVVKNGKPLLIDDIAKDKRFKQRGAKKYYNNSLLSVPLKTRDDIVGVLNVNNKINKAPFSEEDLTILIELTKRAAVVLHNSCLYETLKQANEQLKQAEQTRLDFTSKVWHDLNAPLANTKYLASVMKKGITGPVNKKQVEHLSLIEESVNRLLKLIENLLSLSKIESGVLRLKKSSWDIAFLVNESMGGFLDTATQKAVTLKTALMPGLPNVCVDKDKVIQVLVNLLSNAVKFTEAMGKVIVSAQRHSDGSDKLVEICISNTGTGISKEDQEKLFASFSRVEKGLLNAKKGTGLGLVIAKEIVQLHGGDIWVESESGKGTKFYFTLPIE